MTALMWSLRAVCLAALLGLLDAKVETGVFALTSNECEHFITKFSFDQGTEGTVKMAFGGHGKLYLEGMHELLVAIYDDEHWERYLEAMAKGSLCSERMRLATRRIPLSTYSPVEDLLNKDSFELKIDTKLTFTERSRYYFFVLSDCSLEFYDAHPPLLDFSLHIRNGNSELPAFESGKHVIQMSPALNDDPRYKRHGQVHLAAAGAVGCLLLQCTASVIESFHLTTYAYDGMGWRWRHGRLPLDFFSDMLTTVSESGVVILIVSVGSGWTLLDGARSHLHRLWTLCTIVAPTQLMLEIVSRRYEDDFSTFHDHDHWPGIALMCFRVAAAVTQPPYISHVLVGGVLVFNNHRAVGRADVAQRKLLKIVNGVGAMWLLAFPVQVLFVAPLTPATTRHATVTACGLFLQSVALSCLCVLFLGLGNLGQGFQAASTISAMGDLGTDELAQTQDKATIASTFRKKVAVD